MEKNKDKNNSKKTATYTFVENTCILCGAVIPEGLMVCPMCEKRLRSSTNQK